MKDIKCAYCNHEFDHDGDFEDLDNNNKLFIDCPKCEKTISTYVEFYPTFSGTVKVECMNGLKCERVKRHVYDNIYNHKCIYCEHSQLIDEAKNNFE